jgi:HEAT repeat protein
VPGQTDKLLRLLSDEDENVRDAALGAVMTLRERRAVKVLTQSRSMRDTREMQKILSALAVLGGAEARDYLSFVAQNHDDDEVRAMAKQALDTLDRSRDHDRPTK